MSAPNPYVTTAAIRHAVKGRETDILRALGIQWSGKSPHIRCPYPDHLDNHPSWRWDQTKARAHCTCTRSASIFDVVCRVKGIDFDAAKIAARAYAERHGVRFVEDGAEPAIAEGAGSMAVELTAWPEPIDARRASATGSGSQRRSAL